MQENLKEYDFWVTAQTSKEFKELIELESISDEIIIDEEIKNRLWKLNETESENLKQSLIKEGCRDALILWNNILIDGHNRFEICKEYNIEFTTINKSFNNKIEVLKWIDTNQLSRRNLTDEQRTILFGRLSKINKQEGFKGNQYTEVQDKMSRTKIADELGVNVKTLQRAEKYVDAIDELKININSSIIDNVLAGKTSFTKENIINISKLEPEKQVEIINKIIENPTLKFDRTFNEISRIKAVDDNFIESIDKVTDIKIGDLFEIGEHRLLCGDSTSIEFVNALMNNEKVDMIFTDPPYGINEKGDRSSRIGMSECNILPDFKDDSTQYAIDTFNHNINKDIPVQVWFGANYYCHSLPETANWLVWDKRVEEKQRDFNSDCELAWVKSNFNSIRIFRHLWKGMMKGSEHGEKRIHTTQKPIALVDYCIKEYFPDCKIILDYFIGGGSTMVAAHQLNKKCYGIELSPIYCQVILDRMIKLDPKIIIKKTNIYE